MAIYVSATQKEIVIRQGDTGNLYFTGLPKDKDYNVFLSIVDVDNDKIIKEIKATTFTQSTGIAYFGINEDTSNSLKVGEWGYALKICADGSEDTFIPRIYINNTGEIIAENAPKFTVLPKFVEGD